MSGSRILHRGAEGWGGVEPRAYKDAPGGHRGVARHLLVGGRDDGSPFEVRAFRVEAGGFTSRERHAHPHAVVVLEGGGRVRLGVGGEEREAELSVGDALWIAPWEAHQLRAGPDTDLIFLCVVPTDRDRPEPVEEGADAAAGGAP
jgi:quercetin dioxygenase-like cupin family protein